jgi:transcription elongation factor Elf1
VNNEGLAEDAWVIATPDDVYDPCPCGCGRKFKFVMKDEKQYVECYQRFIDNWLKVQTQGERS